MISGLAWSRSLHADAAAAYSRASVAAGASRPSSRAAASPPGDAARTAATEDSYEPTPLGRQLSDEAQAAEGAPDGEPTGAGEPAAEDEGADGLSADERKMISDLQRRDRDVRAHEAAHQSAGGGIVGGASFSFQTGPDGRRYAIGGEVSVDASAVPNDPAATITKMQQVRAAALAPVDPSAQDLAVASAAAQALAAAQQEQARQRADDGKADGKDDEADVPALARKAGEAEAEPARRAEPLELGLPPAEVSAILGGQRRQRWLAAVLGQPAGTGQRVDLSA